MPQDKESEANLVDPSEDNGEWVDPSEDGGMASASSLEQSDEEMGDPSLRRGDGPNRTSD